LKRKELKLKGMELKRYDMNGNEAKRTERKKNGFEQLRKDATRLETN